MVPVALIEREWSGSRLEVPLPEIFADLDYWIKNEGDDWLQAHLDASDEWLWDEYGIDWNIIELDWYETLESFLGKFRDDE